MSDTSNCGLLKIFVRDQCVVYNTVQFLRYLKRNARFLEEAFMYTQSINYQSKHNSLFYKIQFRATCFDSFESSSDPSRNRSKKKSSYADLKFGFLQIGFLPYMWGKKVHPCTGTEALYRPYGP